jgi:hypothetical protein
VADDPGRDLLAEARRTPDDAEVARRRIMAAVERRARRRPRPIDLLLMWLKVFVPMLLGILIGIAAHAWWMARGR